MAGLDACPVPAAWSKAAPLTFPDPALAGSSVSIDFDCTAADENGVSRPMVRIRSVASFGRQPEAADHVARDLTLLIRPGTP